MQRRQGVGWRRWLRMGLPVALAVAGLSLAGAASRLSSSAASVYPLSPTVAFHPWLAAHPPAGEEDLAGLEIPLEVPLEPGQTLSDVLGEVAFAPADAQLIAGQVARFTDLRRLRPVDRYAVSYGEQGLPDGFELTLDGKGRVLVERGAGGWDGRFVPFVQRVEVESVVGELDGFLEGSIERAGGDPAVAYLMADVLQWDIDFTRDLREGDRFAVLYEAIYLDGAFHSLGNVLALSYENRGRRVEAYRFGRAEGDSYYDADGRPLRKMFLRAPLRFSRITDRFTQRRFHPVLKKYRPHYGVDYAAPTGTPVRATASGVVSFAGWDRGGGRTVKVKHPNGYLTEYLHLSRFASGIRSGARVSQGEVVGYVGSTGLATGPHLDYRVQRNGRWIDPLSIKSVPADPIPTDRLVEFTELRDRLRRSLWEGEPWSAPVPPAETGQLATARPVPDSDRGR